MRPRSILFGWAAVFVSSAVAQNKNDDEKDDESTTTDDNTSTSSSKSAPSSTTGKSTTTTTTDKSTTQPTSSSSSSSLPDIGQTSSTSSSTTSTTSSTTQQSVPVPSSSLSVLSLVHSLLPSSSGGSLLVIYYTVPSGVPLWLSKWQMTRTHILPLPAPFYKYSDQASSVSLSNAPAARSARKSRGPIPSSTPSQSNLFFSPTAPAGVGSAASRESRFLPSGFYASGAASPQQAQGHSISLTNLRPDSRGHGRTVEPSPPDSPSLAPPPEMGRRNLSSSSINLNRPPSGRAPSAFLEDLLGDQPDQFPPPGHRNTWNQPSARF
ncbi:hypothetical protein CIB48_g494 [Xylaria polymorpha]|nr:hypothetical protein CIB48_g494 [Xylaria polymorpha]